jgi:hypothetical protein
VGISFIFLPVVINSVSPIVDNQPVATKIIPGTPYSAQTFQNAHPASVNFALEHAALLKLVQQHEAVVVRADVDPSAANLFAVVAAIGTKNALALNALKGQFNTLVVPFQKELTYLSANQAALTDVQNGLAKSPKQWQHWFWVCVGGMVLFIPTIWLNRGRWSPKRAREDENQHEEDVARELKELVGANA